MFSVQNPLSSKSEIVLEPIHSIMSFSNASSSLTPSEQSFHSQSVTPSSHTSRGKVGKGIVHNGYIYGITDDSPLAAALDKLTDKKE
jgi:hypothetical protein